MQNFALSDHLLDVCFVFKIQIKYFILDIFVVRSLCWPNSCLNANVNGTIAIFSYLISSCNCLSKRKINVSHICISCFVEKNPCLFVYLHIGFCNCFTVLLLHSFYLLYAMFKFARCCYHMHSNETYWFRSPHSWHSWQTPRRYPSPIWKVIISLTHPTTTGIWF